MDLVDQTWREVTCSNIKNAWRKIPQVLKPIKEDTDTSLELEMNQIITSITREEMSEEKIPAYLAECEKEENMQQEAGDKQDVVEESIPQNEETKLWLQRRRNKKVRKNSDLL